MHSAMAKPETNRILDVVRALRQNQRQRAGNPIPTTKKVASRARKNSKGEERDAPPPEVRRRRRRRPAADLAPEGISGASGGNPFRGTGLSSKSGGDRPDVKGMVAMGRIDREEGFGGERCRGLGGHLHGRNRSAERAGARAIAMAALRAPAQPDAPG